MFTAALLAASLLAPSGVTAGIQADPVCLPVTAQPGHSYPLTIYAPGAVSMSAGPTGHALASTLHQISPDWVTFGAGDSGSIPLTLSIPSGAAPGAYWSDITATSGASGPGQVQLGTAATTALVFTVGPSATPPPPCIALDLAQSTGKMPPWPDGRFATSSMRQLLARSAHDGPKPVLSPTAGTGQQQAAPAPAYSPAASQAGQGDGGKLIGWALIAAVALYVLSRIFKRRSS
jgi:hypothetical protein